MQLEGICAPKNLTLSIQAIGWKVQVAILFSVFLPESPKLEPYEDTPQ